jgi:very-short-patch-repair endonuclease
VLKYCANLKAKSRQLRSNLTESERALWSGLRSKQVLGVQFYRQKPIGESIVDFFAPRAKWVIEVDGSQHVEEKQAKKDKNRDDYLASLGFKVLRFTGREVLKEREAVAEVIYRTIQENLSAEIPPGPPEAVKKSGGMEFGGRYHVQGTAKICLPKEAVISSLSAVYELVPEGKWKSYFIYTG